MTQEPEKLDPELKLRLLELEQEAESQPDFPDWKKGIRIGLWMIVPMWLIGIPLGWMLNPHWSILCFLLPLPFLIALMAAFRPVK